MTPDETTPQTYPEAWQALWRATAARIVTLPGTSRLIASINMEGSRMLVANGEAGSLRSDPSASAIMMIDTSNNMIVGTPIPASEADVPDALRADGDLRFSRDGRFASATLYARHVIAILDGQTGERLFDLDVEGEMIAIGFSPDSRYFAAFSGTKVVVWDLEGKQLAYTIPLPAPGVDGIYTASAWTQSGQILGSKMNMRGVIDSVLLIDQTGVRTIASDLALAGMGMLVPDSGNTFVLVGLEISQVFTDDGEFIGQTQGTEWLMRLVRDGSATAVPRLLGTMSLASLELSVMDFQGNPLATQPSDFGPFSSFVMSPDGQLRAAASLSAESGPAYSAQDLPVGIALHAIALEELQAADIAVDPSGQKPAQADLPDLQALRSLDFAREARRSLRSGDRVRALVAALKGLPEDPVEVDFDRFSAAHLMLFRATSARTLQVDFAGDASYQISPDGTRGIALQYDVQGLRARAILADAGRSQAIGPVTHPTRGDTAFRTSTEAPSFSADSQFFALELAEGDAISVFRATDGAFVRDLIIPNTQLSDKRQPPTFAAGFSPDGQRFAAQNGKRLFVFDVSSGAVVETASTSEVGAYVAGWGPNGRLYFNAPGRDVPARIYAYENGQFHLLFEMTKRSGDPDPGAQIFPSIESGNIIAIGGDEAYVIYDANGNRKLEIPGGLPAIFVRSGRAVLSPNLSGDVGDEIDIYDLDGKKLEPRPEDYVIFDSGLFTNSGPRLSFQNNAHYIKWEGAGTPTGRELYDIVWNALPSSIQEEIRGERVSRD